MPKNTASATKKVKLVKLHLRFIKRMHPMTQQLNCGERDLTRNQTDMVYEVLRTKSLEFTII